MAKIKAQAIKSVDAEFPRSVTIREAVGGFIVSMYGERKEKLEVVKDWDAAQKSAKKMIGAK